MPRNSHGPAPRGAAVEVARLIRRNQALKVELDSAERRRRAEPELGRRSATSSGSAGGSPPLPAAPRPQAR